MATPTYMPDWPEDYHDIQSNLDEAELEIGRLSQAYEELRRAIPVQALTNILDYLDDTNYPEYWDQQAVIALLDRMREE